jgi:hypothetical protein
MAAVGTAHRRNISGVAGSGEPIVNGGADGAPPDRRLARTMMAGNQKNHPLVSGSRLIERAVDGVPGAVEVEPVKVNDAVRLNDALLQAAIPAAVEGLVLDRAGRGAGWFCRRRCWCRPGWRRQRACRFRR